jgi:outer membrane protein
MTVMKKLNLIVALLVLSAATAVAQRYGFVDSNYIRENIPAFATAQEQLDILSQQWEKEVADGYAVVEQMYRSYQNEAARLSQDLRTQREEAIVTREREVKALQNKYFGMEGDLFKKRDELISPIQERVFKAINEIAVEGNYTAIFDIASGGNILFVNPNADISNQVLEKLGYKN